MTTFLSIYYGHFKDKMPFFLYVISYYFMKKTAHDLIYKDNEIIISDFRIKTVFYSGDKNGYYENGTIFINEKYRYGRKYKRILRHEIFHYIEDVRKVKTYKLISETAARIFSRLG